MSEGRHLGALPRGGGALPATGTIWRGEEEGGEGEERSVERKSIHDKDLYA